jgi:PKD repeat protein
VQSPTHPYATGGTYTVSLTVTDDDGATNTTSQTVTVTGESPITLTAEVPTWGSRNRVVLDWTGATGLVDVLRDGEVIRGSLPRDFFVDIDPGTGTFLYQVCEQQTSVCSNTVTVEL